MKLKLFTFLLLFLSSSLVVALENPVPTEFDSRVRFVNYNPDNVTRIVGTFNSSIQIVFSENENIQDISLGNSLSWQAVPSGNLLFIKPREKGLRTNMQIVTSMSSGETRSYQFELNSRIGDISNENEDVFFKVQFNYPQDKLKQQQQDILANRTKLEKEYIKKELTGKTSRLTSMLLTSKKHYARKYKYTKKQRRTLLKNGKNYNYAVKGANYLFPTVIYDNGRSTYMKFDRFQGIPSIFTISPDGTEVIANLTVKGDWVNIKGVYKQFRVRFNTQVACLFNLIKYKKYLRDTTGTVSKNIQRKLKQ